MAELKVVVVGASEGGVETLIKLIEKLPKDFPAAVLIVQHLSPHRPSMLPYILSRSSKLAVSAATNLETIKPGHIYVAPPDQHLIIEDGNLRLVRGPKENFSRPSVDVLFRSAAVVFGPRVIGVILSGAMGDGASGLQAIKSAGGVAIIQDPNEALNPSMPLAAAQEVQIDTILPVAKIADELVKLSKKPLTSMKKKKLTKKNAKKKLAEKELKQSKFKEEQLAKEGEYGEPSVYACPDCRGVLWEIKDGELTRFRCRTGHGYLPEVLSERQSDNIESSLWAAMTALEEKSSLSLRLARKFSDIGDVNAEKRFRQKSKDSLAKAEVIRQILIKEEPQ
jgi:two-component system, chemotaxis family, protein-glutamate methylesterase/glutaminase